VFYIYALYVAGEYDGAFRLLRKMLPGESDEDIIQRGQMPVFIPNYYRGAYSQFPRTAGRSSHLFNTGTVSWYYRCLVDCLFGLRGTKAGLSVHPGFPSHWKEASVTRCFRGAKIHTEIRRVPEAREITVLCEGKPLTGGVLTDIIAGKDYRLSVKLPLSRS
jgi:cellobionic acid phosphorylase